MKPLRKSLPILILLVAILSACAPQPAVEELSPVTVQLKWVHQAQFAGFYAAVDKGFYAEEGLDVTINPGGVDIDIMDEVLSGRAEFWPDWSRIRHSQSQRRKTSQGRSPPPIVTIPLCW